MGDISFPLSSDMPPSRPFSSQDFSEGWRFRQSDDTTASEVSSSSWLPVKKIPSTVHQDLVDNGKLEDPFVGFNEIKAEWVGEKAWTYQKSFKLDHELHAGMKVVLAFDGLDTFATIKLDGKTIGKSENMFLPLRIDVTEHLLHHSRHTATGEAEHPSNNDNNHNQTHEHVLEIEFESALLKGKELQKQHPGHKYIAANGDSSRLCARKAQYHWGWDWGPLLICCGIWKPVRLETYTAKIVDVRTEVEFIDGAYDEVRLNIGVKTEGIFGEEAMVASTQVEIKVRGPNFEKSTIASFHGGRIDQSETEENDGSVTATVSVDRPKLWMPCGYGEQNLYEVEVSLFSHAVGAELHTTTKRIGIRKVELVQEPDKHGKSFYFRINGIDVFCGGSCWIPADSFLTNLTPERYRAWIELMVPANQKMIRIWGGGIYEDEAFYDACDELGIMVWQDFMFGCGNYPTWPSLLDSIRAEATANVRRIRHHPSIVIFAGNNEDYQVAEQQGLTYDYDDKDEDNWLKTDFPARIIYESLLPKVVAAESPEIPYHPGSPWGDGKATSDPTVGDIHQWNIWHGSQEKYQIFDALGGRFNSEFGMEAFPHIATIKSFVTNPEDLYPQSHVIDFHNKADGHERRIATYLVENVRTATELEAYIHLSQLIQCEALMFGYRGWRKQWGDSRKCGGALVWQLNDCWPVTSWSICDYYLRRKPAYYAMARVLAPVTVGIRRAHHDWSVTHAREPKSQDWELWAVSSKLEDVVADIEVKFISVRTGKQIKEPLMKTGIRLTANGTTDIANGSVDNFGEEPHVLAARIWVDGKLVGRDTDWPQPLKYLPFPDRNVKVKVVDDEIHVSVDRPVKCLVFEERKGCHLSDSAIDLVPGDEQIVKVRGLQKGDPPLNWTYLGAGEQ